MKIDTTKPVKTRDGRDVEIISDKGRGMFSLIGYIADFDLPDTWQADGTYKAVGSTGADLIQEPEKKTLWVNVYKEGVRGFVAHRTKEDADFQAVSDRIACVKVTYIDGQFDEE